MIKKNKIRQLSINNNCLSADTINKYLTGRLNPEENKLVKKHINECEFCADAIEGYKKIKLKDSFVKTVKQINVEIDKKYKLKDYKFLFTNKSIVAYSSLAASILILIGLFILINNIKIHQNNLITEKLTINENKQIKHESSERNEKPGSIISPDSFPKEINERKTTASEKEILLTRSKSSFKYDDKTEEKEVIESEPIEDIHKKETDRGIAEVEYPDMKVIEAPTAKEAEITGSFKHERQNSREEKKFAKKSYSLPQDIFTLQMQEEEISHYDETVFVIADEMPKFENKGLEHFIEYVQNNMQYPSEAKKLKIEGKVFINFAIDTIGRVVDAKIIEGADSLLNKEALRVINASPLWTPGKQDGNPVKVTYVIPVIFKIE